MLTLDSQTKDSLPQASAFEARVSIATYKSIPMSRVPASALLDVTSSSSLPAGVASLPLCTPLEVGLLHPLNETVAKPSISSTPSLKRSSSTGSEPALSVSYGSAYLALPSPLPITPVSIP